ncbi:UNVERIFIED_ORG: hypothetical protein GGE63_005378 [Rhizobium esperanzae]
MVRFAAAEDVILFLLIVLLFHCCGIGVERTGETQVIPQRPAAVFLPEEAASAQDRHGLVREDLQPLREGVWQVGGRRPLPVCRRAYPQFHNLGDK